jgi:hypothetical protein
VSKGERIVDSHERTKRDVLAKEAGGERLTCDLEFAAEGTHALRHLPNPLHVWKTPPVNNSLALFCA